MLFRRYPSTNDSMVVMIAMKRNSSIGLEIIPYAPGSQIITCRQQKTDAETSDAGLVAYIFKG